MKETDYLNFKSSDMLTKNELKLFYSRDALYKSTILASTLIKYFYFNQQSQQYHSVSNNLPLNIQNMNEYIATMCRKLLLESMTFQKMIRRSAYEKQIEYFLDIAPDVKMKLIINNALNYHSDDESDDETDDESDDESDEDKDHVYFSLPHIKNKLKIAQYDTQTVEEILESLI